MHSPLMWAQARAVLERAGILALPQLIGSLSRYFIDENYAS